MRFLREIMGIREEKLRAQLFIYNDVDEDNTLSFWSNELGIPRNQFNKSILLNQRSGKYIPSKYGTMKIRYYDKLLRLRLE